MLRGFIINENNNMAYAKSSSRADSASVPGLALKCQCHCTGKLEAFKCLNSVSRHRLEAFKCLNSVSLHKLARLN